MSCLIWFREDLRGANHPALHAAAGIGCPVTPLYIFDPKLGGKWAMGDAQKVWLHKSLEALSEEIPLNFLTGETLECLEKAVNQSRATHLFFSRSYTPAGRAIEKKLKKHFPDLVVEGFEGAYLINPENVLNQKGEPFRVFTPFFNAALKAVTEKPNYRNHTLKFERLKGSLSLRQLGLLTNERWENKILNYWDVGEKAAQKKVRHFVAHSLRTYSRDRDRVDLEGTSTLSPHLHFGEVSIHSLYALTKENRSFVSELFWREFSAYLLYHFPTLADKSFKETFDDFEWAPNKEHYHAWTRGETGIPIVDAAMRALWETGWMHNRARMIVASFLTKNLLISWQTGEKWFWDTLVDADLANNSGSWQWVAGSGADAAPYFRIFNPVLQAQKFDPEGHFIKKWVPELAHLNAPEIFSPWTSKSKVIDYPKPIVDLAKSRDIALTLYKKLKK